MVREERVEPMEIRFTHILMELGADKLFKEWVNIHSYGHHCVTDKITWKLSVWRLDQYWLDKASILLLYAFRLTFMGYICQTLLFSLTLYTKFIWALVLKMILLFCSCVSQWELCTLWCELQRDKPELLGVLEEVLSYTVSHLQDALKERDNLEQALYRSAFIAFFYQL